MRALLYVPSPSPTPLSSSPNSPFPSLLNHSSTCHSHHIHTHLSLTWVLFGSLLYTSFMSLPHSHPTWVSTSSSWVLSGYILHGTPTLPPHPHPPESQLAPPECSLGTSFMSLPPHGSISTWVSPGSSWVLSGSLISPESQLEYSLGHSMFLLHVAPTTCCIHLSLTASSECSKTSQLLILHRTMFASDPLQLSLSSWTPALAPCTHHRSLSRTVLHLYVSLEFQLFLPVLFGFPCLLPSSSSLDSA